MKRVLYDLNVVLDVLLRRDPHFPSSAVALDAVGQGRVQGYIAGHAVTTLAYLLEKELSATKSRRVLAELLSKLQVAAVTDAGIHRGLALGFHDFEDAVTAACAEEAGVAVIVTRNVGDFRKSPIPVVPPSLFVAD
ncbi:MAG: PIN domain-containing protein [Nitrospirota bacterium]